MNFPKDIETYLAAISEYLRETGSARELEVLLVSRASMDSAPSSYDSDYSYWILLLELDVRFYAALDREGVIQETEKAICEAGGHFLRHRSDRLVEVTLVPAAKANAKWREDVRDYLTGRGVNNQGRVRSSNIAARRSDDLLFRSQPEIHLYAALKKLPLTFAPLPVFVRNNRRLEPDFVLLKDGVVMVVEIDGPATHKESPVEAHARLRPLDYEGARIERVSADECDDPQKAEECATKLMKLLQKRIQQKG